MPGVNVFCVAHGLKIQSPLHDTGWQDEWSDNQTVIRRDGEVETGLLFEQNAGGEFRAARWSFTEYERAGLVKERSVAELPGIDEEKRTKTRAKHARECIRDSGCADAVVRNAKED